MAIFHNLSPIKTAKNQSISRTTSNCKLLQAQQEALQDSTPLYILIYNYQDSNMPFLLKDVILKEDESDWLFNQQSTANSCTNSDISFHFRKKLPTNTMYRCYYWTGLKNETKSKDEHVWNIVFGRPET